MSIFQIVAVLFALFMVYVVTIQQKKEVLSAVEASFWYSTWGFFIVVTLFPQLLIDFTTIFRFSRVFDLLVVAAFMVLSTLAFINYFKEKSMEKKLERFVRQEAIDSVKKKSLRKK